MNPKEAQAWPRLCLDIQAERDEAIAQRDELVAALEEIATRLPRSGYVALAPELLQDIARAALAKVTS